MKWAQALYYICSHVCNKMHFSCRFIYNVDVSLNKGLKGIFENNNNIYLTFIFLMAPFPKIEVEALLIGGL